MGRGGIRMIFLLVSYGLSGFARRRQDPQDFRKISVNMHANFRNFRILIVMIVSMYFSLADSNSTSEKHYDR